MYHRQSSLPEMEINKNPKFTHIKVAEVIGNKDFDKKGVLYARFSKGGRPCPVYVYEHGVRVKPEEGDLIIVGYLEESKSMPYFAGFSMDDYACANFVTMAKDAVTIQFPVDAADRKEHMTDPDKLNLRPHLTIKDGSVEFYYPTGSGTGNKITMNGTSVSIELASNAKLNLGGTTPIARKGDAVSVTVSGTTYTGTITGGSTKVNAG